MSAHTIQGAAIMLERGEWAAERDALRTQNAELLAALRSSIKCGIDHREALRAQNAELLAALERCRSLLVTAEGQFSGEFQQRVRTATSDARAAIAKAQS